MGMFSEFYEDFDDWGPDFDYTPRKKSYKKVKADKLVHSTEKAYLFSSKQGRFWVPKSICRKITKTHVEVSKSFKIKYLSLIDKGIR